MPAGPPVIAAAGDKACEVLGSGALEPHIGAISYGTTATINTTQRRYVEAFPLVPPYPAAVPGRVLARGPGLPRLLDGRVVQARVRRTRGRAAQELGRRGRGAVRRAPRGDPAGLDGPDPPAVPGRRACAIPARRRRARSSASATSTPGRTSTGRSSRASPTRCARARERTASAGEGAASASCASRAAAPSRRRRSSSPPTSSGCRRRGPTPTRRRGLGAAIDAAVGLGPPAERSTRRSAR